MIQAKNIFIIAKKELKNYYVNPASYIVIVVFLLLWEFLFFRNAFLASEASLNNLFGLLPWLSLFLIPALTMGSIAQEKNEGTLELLLSHPLRDAELILGKFLGTFIFIFICLLFVLPIAFAFSTYGNLDWGVVAGQFLASFLLVAALISLGVFISSLFLSQIAALIVIAVSSFFLIIFGSETVTGNLPASLGSLLERLSLSGHYYSMSRGIIDLRDLWYFLTTPALFLFLAYLQLLKRRIGPKRFFYRKMQLIALGSVILIIFVNGISNYIPGRLDLTQDQIYTLSKVTTQTVRNLPEPVKITLFVSKNLPAQVQPVVQEVKDTLRDYKTASRGKVEIIYQDPSNNDSAAKEARDLGIQEAQFNVTGNEEIQVKKGYLGLAVFYQDQKEVIPLLQDITDLEYQITGFIKKLATTDKKKIVFVSGHGEKSLDRELKGLDTELSKQFTVESLALSDTSPEFTKEVATLVIAGPSEPINPVQREKIQTYLDQGGKAIFLIDTNFINPQTMAGSKNENSFADFLENYGVKINTDFVYDLRANQTLSFSEGSGISYYLPYPFWPRAIFSDPNSRLANKIESLVIPWPSSINPNEAKIREKGLILTKVLTTSKFGGAVAIDASLMPEQKFPSKTQSEELLAFVLGQDVNKPRIFVASDSEFLTDALTQNSPENLAFGLNLISYLSQEDSLGSIQIKQTATRKLNFDNQSQVKFVKYGNLALVGLFPILVSILVIWRRRGLKKFSYNSKL